MKINFGLILVFLTFIAKILFAESSTWQDVEKVFGKKGMVIEEVFKITFPRSDLKVSVDKVPIEPGLTLTSWIGFQPMNNGTMMMGDLVLLNREVAPVMSKLLAEGVEVTALHNHLIGESPSVMYMHFSASGEPVDLAKKMKAALVLTQTPSQSNKIMSNVDWKGVESILGRTGKAQGDLLQVSVPRPEAITENNVILAPSMGIANAINFQMLGRNAATTGDFVLLANEVNPVIKALNSHGITVTAIHNHMLFESPRLFMLHFWGVDKPEKLAQGVRVALDQIHSAK